jgi:hypothetical protein
MIGPPPRALFRWPRFLRRAQPELTDGLAELEIAWQCLALLLTLPPMSQARALDHLDRILRERAVQLEDFEASLRER